MNDLPDCAPSLSACGSPRAHSSSTTTPSTPAPICKNERPGDGRPRTRCAILREFEIDPWTDRRILVGQDWEQEIGRAIDASDFGLLCITPSFLASEYVTTVELPALVPRPFRECAAGNEGRFCNALVAEIVARMRGTGPT